MKKLFTTLVKINDGYQSRLKRVIFMSWIKMVAKNRFIDVGAGGLENLLGKNVSYGHRGSFHGMFTEIFIDQNYRIAPTDKPLTIIDCGSNIGLASLYFRIIAPNSKITSFEPNPVTFEILSQNIEKNSLHITAVNSGVGLRDEVVTLYTDVNDSSSQSASVTKHLESKGRDITEINVTIEKLSKYISQPVDILKLDIEGAEGDVLEELVEAGKLPLINVLFIEYHNDGKNTKYPLSRILEILESGDFKYEIFSNYGLPFAYWKSAPMQSLKITAWKA